MRLEMGSGYVTDKTCVQCYLDVHSIDIAIDVVVVVVAVTVAQIVSDDDNDATAEDVSDAGVSLCFDRHTIDSSQTTNSTSTLRKSSFIASRHRRRSGQGTAVPHTCQKEMEH